MVPTNWTTSLLLPARETLDIGRASCFLIIFFLFFYFCPSLKLWTPSVAQTVFICFLFYFIIASWRCHTHIHAHGHIYIPHIHTTYIYTYTYRIYNTYIPQTYTTYTYHIYTTYTYRIYNTHINDTHIYIHTHIPGLP